MAKPAAKRSGSSKGGGSLLLTGILVGMVIGVGLAAGLAWLITQSPAPTPKTEPVAKPAVKTETQPPKAEVEEKPRFEFYEVLTEKTPDVASGVPVVEPKPDMAPLTFPAQFLQVGAFPHQADAEDRKAELALQGLVATVQAADIPNKGIWYRVRLGPYKSQADLTRAETLLKQNGVDYTPIKAE